MAQAGLKTIIVDADLRRPVQHEIFQLPNLEGLTELLCSPEPELDQYLRKSGVENLLVVTSGAIPPNPSELVGSKRILTTPVREWTSRPQAILQGGEVLGMAIGRDNQLFSSLVERIERMEELLEDLLFALEELNVIQQQQVGVAVPGLELRHTLAPNAFDEVIEEPFRRYVSHDQCRIEVGALLPDGVEQVGLTKPGIAIDEERVVVASWLL